MTNPISFNRNYTTHPGKLEELTPWLRRITAPNPSAFTFRGTGTYVVGKGKVAVIDPGPAIDSHIKALVDGLGDEVITHILVTHAHLDHSPGCELLRQYTDAPVYGYDTRAREISGRDSTAGYDETFSPDNYLVDGDIVSGDGWSFESVHTPGHTSDHLCFSLREKNVLFCGDHVMGWSTSIVSPPDGNMGDYMRSLQRLLDRQESVYWPTHGASIEQPQEMVKALIRHRLDREAHILSSIDQGYNTISAMLPVIYADIARQLYPAAERSLLASIEYLLEKNQLDIERQDDSEPRYLLS